jgi:hypothetical protein
MKRGTKAALIGDEVEGFILAKGSQILYRTGQPHRCDKKCLASDHRYKHRVEVPALFRFEKKFPILGTPDHEFRIPGVGRSEDV